MEKINRRQFLKDLGIILAGASVANFAFPLDSFGAYNNPRDFLKSLPNEELLARMIFGEARGCSLDEKVWIGYTPINRMNDKKKYNGEGSLKDVLLYKDQYHCLGPKSEDKKSRDNFRKVLQPEKYEPNLWRESLDIANKIVNGKLKGYNYGQTSFITKDKVSELIKGKLPINPRKIDFIATPRDFKHQFYFEI